MIRATKEAKSKKTETFFISTSLIGLKALARMQDLKFVTQIKNQDFLHRQPRFTDEI